MKYSDNLQSMQTVSDMLTLSTSYANALQKRYVNAIQMLCKYVLFNGRQGLSVNASSYYISLSLLQDIEIMEIGFPMPEFIHNCMNECMGKPISVILIS